MPKRTNKLSANARFASLCKYIEKVQDELTGIMHTDTDSLRLYANRDADVQNAFRDCERATSRKRKYTWRKAMEYPECVAVNKRHMDAGNEIVARLRTEVRACKEAQFLLAPECSLAAERSKRARAFFASCADSYRSQGWGANKYAKGSAEEEAGKARAYGIDCEVKAGKGTYMDYVVKVRLTEVGCDILRALPNVDLRERVRLCWKRGVNPRVYMPFLPHGYEESRGLNFFGGTAP